MSIKTSEVTGRRALCFESYTDLLLDAEFMVLDEVLMLGNWTLGQVFLHLAKSMHASIDGIHGSVSGWRRLTVRMLYGRQLLTGPMPAGLRLPPEVADSLLPEPITAEDGLAALREAVQRLSFETERARHPLLGELSLDEWDSFHLRHAELHLSFALPVRTPVLV